LNELDDAYHFNTFNMGENMGRVWDRLCKYFGTGLIIIVIVIVLLCFGAGVIIVLSYLAHNFIEVLGVGLLAGIFIVFILCIGMIAEELKRWFK